MLELRVRFNMDEVHEKWPRARANLLLVRPKRRGVEGTPEHRSMEPPIIADEAHLVAADLLALGASRAEEGAKAPAPTAAPQQSIGLAGPVAAQMASLEAMIGTVPAGMQIAWRPVLVPTPNLGLVQLAGMPGSPQLPQLSPAQHAAAVASPGVAASAEGQGAAATSADANGETSGAADLLSAYPPAPSPAVAQPRLAAPNGAKGEVVRAESSAAPQEPGVVVQHGLLGAVLGAPALLRLPAALGLPGSSCRRGAHGKQGWTREEDQQILQHVQTTGPKWSSIAEALPGRTDDAVRNRYLRLVKKATRKGVGQDGFTQAYLADCASIKNGDMWTAEEDAAIMDGVMRIGQKWQQISDMLPGRSANAVRNRYLRCEGVQGVPTAGGLVGVAGLPAAGVLVGVAGQQQPGLDKSADGTLVLTPQGVISVSELQAASLNAILSAMQTAWQNAAVLNVAGQQAPAAAQQSTGLTAVQAAGLQALQKQQAAGLNALQAAGLNALQQAGLQALQAAGLQSLQVAGLNAVQQAGLQALQAQAALQVSGGLGLAVNVNGLGLAGLAGLGTAGLHMAGQNALGLNAVQLAGLQALQAHGLAQMLSAATGAAAGVPTGLALAPQLLGPAAVDTVGVSVPLSPTAVSAGGLALSLGLASPALAAAPEHLAT